MSDLIELKFHKSTLIYSPNQKLNHCYYRLEIINLPSSNDVLITHFKDNEKLQNFLNLYEVINIKDGDYFYFVSHSNEIGIEKKIRIIKEFSYDECVENPMCLHLG